MMMVSSLVYGQQVPGLRHLTLRDGLSQGFVKAILQDSEGFIWVGTLHGLNRYDGYSFRVWYPDPRKPDALPMETITALAEDGWGRLWVGTLTGVRIFDRHTYHFYRPLGVDGQVLAAANRSAWILKALPNGAMLQASDHHTFIYEPLDTLGTAFAVQDRPEVNRINEAESVLRRRGIPLAPLGNDSLSIVGRHTAAPFFRLGNDIYQLATSRPPALPFPSPGERIFRSPYPIENWYLDRQGILWIGTNAYGLLRYDPSIRKFRSHAPGHSVYFPIGLDRTRVALGDRVWDLVVNCQTQRTEPAPWAARYPTFFPVGKDRQGRLLLFSYTSARYALHRLAGMPVMERSATPIYGNMAETANGDVFLVYKGQYLLHYPANDSLPNSYDFGADASFSGLPYILGAIVRDGEGRLWMGTKAGLVRATPRPGGGYHFQRYAVGGPAAGGTDPGNVLALWLDESRPHTLWVGAKGGGLNRLDLQTGRWKSYTTADGLPDNVVSGILPDPGGGLWLSTNRGLCLFHPDRLRVDYYTADDGLQSDEFNTYAFSRTEWGELIFGGVNGITRFFPRDIRGDTLPPPVYITDLRVNDQSLQPGDGSGLLDRSIIYTRQIELGHRQNTLTFQFAALDYSIPEKNRYRYRLVGADDGWREAGTQRTVNYTNLPPGRYTFEVMGSNSDGIWSTRPAALAIRIRPPWWWSTPAKALYLLLLLGLVSGIYRFEYRRLRLKHQLALQRREADTLKQLDVFKSNLYTNITHEFRTPLTVILGMARDLLKRPQAGPAKLALIHRNGSYLFELVNQLLDLAKAESNQLSIDLIQGNVVIYLRYLTESFQTLAQQRQLSLQLDLAVPTLVMDYDAEKLRQILTNLLSNAIKFSRSGGQVRVEINRDETGKEFVLTVADTGPGIPAEELPYIFDRFYQGENSQSVAGTGIGLALTRELVQLLRGRISVQSRLGEGTTFEVRLPIANNAPLAGEEKWEGGRTVDGRRWTVDGIEVGSEQVTAGESPRAVLPTDGGLPALLLVEDNPDVAFYLRTILQPHYRLYLANDGRAGIERALELVPDIIISDVMMPEVDGLMLCDTLKNDLRTSHIPIVLLTAKADVHSRISGLRRGADDYLAKPFHEEELRVRLERLLLLRRRLRENYLRIGLGAAEHTLPAPAMSEPASAEELDAAFMRTLYQFLEAEFRNADLKQEDICRATGMGRTNLNQKLTALTGLSAMQLLRRYRLRHAEKMLLESDRTVAEIAYAAGFDDPKYFSRFFTKEHGQSPSAYRKGR